MATVDCCVWGVATVTDYVWGVATVDCCVWGRGYCKQTMFGAWPL